MWPHSSQNQNWAKAATSREAKGCWPSAWFHNMQVKSSLGRHHVVLQCDVSEGSLEPRGSHGEQSTPQPPDQPPIGSSPADSSATAPAADPGSELPAAAVGRGMPDGACTPYDSAWNVRWRSVQRGLGRYNCADSLDRTNAATYFAAVQVSCQGNGWLAGSMCVARAAVLCQSP